MSFWCSNVYSNHSRITTNNQGRFHYSDDIISAFSAGFRLRTNSLRALEDVPSKAVTKASVAAAESLLTVPSLPTQTVPDGQSSISLNSSEVFGRPEYLGICVPVDISMIFQVLRSSLSFCPFLSFRALLLTLPVIMSYHSLSRLILPYYVVLWFIMRHHSLSYKSSLLCQNPGYEFLSLMWGKNFWVTFIVWPFFRCWEPQNVVHFRGNIAYQSDFLL